MSPFDAARYARLLEGLEVVELRLAEVQRENEKLRLDSGYFAKPMLAADAVARAYPGGCDDLGKLFSRFVKGIFDINASSYTDEGVPFLRIQNLKNGVVDEGTLAFIPEVVHQQEIKTALRRGDIVLSKTAYPAASLVTVDRCNTSQDTIATTLSDFGSSNYQPEAVVAYLNSSAGKQLLWRQFQGNVQLHLSLDDGRKVPVPRFSPALQKRISESFQLAQKARESASKSRESAEALLSNLLKLDCWVAPEPLSYVRSSGEAFASGRLDAQHFQPRFQALTEFIDATGQSARLADWLSENQRGRQPEYAEKGLPVVNSKHVLRGDVRLDDDNRNASFGDDDLLIHQGDVLMNGTGVGTIGRCAPYLHAEAAIPDNHVTVLRPKKGLDAVYLSVFLNSMAGQWQVEQRLRGSSGQIELYPNDIGQFRVWVAP
jgi:type I restriction enzyme M protein